MDLNEHIFREYDIRGIVDKDLNPEVAYSIGKGFGTFVKRRGGKTVVTGRDLRTTSKPYQDKVIQGIRECGLDVINVGEVSTPIVSFAIKTLLENENDGAITITASHNPREYNGFKIKLKKEPVWGGMLQEIKNTILKQDFEIADKQGSLTEKSVNEDYVNYIVSDIKVPTLLKVVIDAGNGTTSEMAPHIIRKLGCEVVELYCEPDGTFPNHIPDPTVEKYMVDLQKKVKETKADIGIAFDGDGDRVGAVNEKGEIIPADLLLLLFAKQVLSIPENNKNIVFDVKCSLGLIQGIEQNKGIPHIWKTGYPNILYKMDDTDSILGGEMSGHMFFRDRYYGFDDGIYAAARLLEILSQSGKKISQLFEEVPPLYSTPEIRVLCSEEDKKRIVEEMGNYLKDKGELITVDGYRLALKDGWGLLRASNTQNALVLRFEAKTKERLESIKSIFMDKLKDYPSIEWDSDH